MSDSGCEWPSESRGEIGNEVIRLRAELAAMTVEVARVHEITSSTFDGEVQQGESLYAAFLKLRDERDTLKSQVESTNTLLRGATDFERALIDALGPYHPSRSIAEDVRVLVAKCERLSAPVSDREEVEHFTLTPILHEDRYVALRNDVDALIAARAGNQPVAKCERLEAPASDGSGEITQERQRQIVSEGWTPEHDDEQSDGELIAAARCYAKYAQYQPMGTADGNHPRWWPWDEEWWKPSPDRVRNLVKAGALIAAEIDRLHREAACAGKEQK